MTTDQSLLVKALKECGAYQEGNFILASGKTSPFFIDASLLTFNSMYGSLLGKVFLEHVDWDTTHIGGPALGAVPIVSTILVYAQIPLLGFAVRKEVKNYTVIEGHAPGKNDRVVVIEDVVTTGKSCLTAVKAIEATGATVGKIIAIIDRLEGGRETLVNYNYISIVTIKEMNENN